jgi:hypothetical protein
MGWVLAGLVATALPGCAKDDDGSGDAGCDGAKCDDAEGDVIETLREFDDPIAVWLRDNVDGQGVLDVGYLDMLRGISEQQGCTEEQIDSYVISDELVADGGAAFPRIVNTVCSTDRAKADMAFFALSFASADGVDVDDRTVEMFAWDPTDRLYRFYKTEPEAGSQTAVRVDIEVVECQDCHLTPDHFDGTQMHMTPIMNELAAPWEHWHAEPQSVNHVVPEATENAPVFSELAGEGSRFLKSAARLEQTIRSSYTQRVAPARLRQRRDKPADPQVAMALLRPLFCDEQLTYITEDGSSGLLDAAAVVDEGFHAVYFQIMGTGWPWEWWNDRILRIDPPGAPDAVNMMPVRGASVIAYEKQLMSSRALPAETVLQVHALDWHTPALSDFRCRLWQTALQRVEANPPEITDDTRTMHLFEPLMTEILTLHPADFGLGGDLPAEIPIAASDPAKVATLSRASDANLQAFAEALAAGTLGEAACEANGAGVCEANVEELGQMIETRFKALESGGRDALNAMRNERACFAKEHYGAVPFIPEVDCTTAGGDGGDTSGDTGGDTSGGDTGGDTGGADTTTGGGSSSCCTAHRGVGCDNPDVQMCVCDQDAFCCETEWDQTCVDQVNQLGCTPGC